MGLRVASSSPSVRAKNDFASIARLFPRISALPHSASAAPRLRFRTTTSRLRFTHDYEKHGRQPFAFPLLNSFSTPLPRSPLALFPADCPLRFAGAVLPRCFNSRRLARTSPKNSKPPLHARYSPSDRCLPSRMRLTASLKSSVQIESALRGTGCMIFTSFASSGLGRSQRSGM